jgi:hypothetical protein
MDLIFPPEYEIMLFFRTHTGFNSVHRISELLIGPHHSNMQDKEWQHIRTLLHHLKRDDFLLVKNEGGNIYDEQFGSTPDRVDRYFEKQRLYDVDDLQNKTDNELKEIMRARVDRQDLPHSIYHKAKMELEFRRQPPLINNGIIAGGPITVGGHITSIHSNNSTGGDEQKSWWKQPKFIITTVLTILGLIGTYASSSLWTQWFNDTPATTQARQTLKGPLTINSLANVQVPNFAIEGKDFVALKNGEYTFVSELSSPDYEVTGYVALLTSTSSYTYSDFNNDGMADVAATIQAKSGGTGTFNYLTVFLNNDGLPEYSTSYYLGDRISVESITASGTDLFVDIITQGPDEPMCCGTTPKSLHLSVYGNSIFEKVDRTGI